MKFRLFLLCWWCLLIVACSVSSDGTQRPWTMQETYWAAGIAFGVVATSLNVILFWRGRPDKVKQAVESAMKPITDRMGSMEVSMKTEREHREEMQVTLVRIEAETDSSPTAQDIAKLHQRISEVVAANSGIAATQATHTQTLGRISEYLMHGGNRVKK